MPVVVHLKNGIDKELRLAQSCAWKSASNGSPGPRWLVCMNQRGDVLATFQEPEINGYRIVAATKAPRFRFPRILNRSAV